MFRFMLAAVVALELHSHVADVEFGFEQDRDVRQYSILISILGNYRMCG